MKVRRTIIIVGALILLSRPVNSFATVGSENDPSWTTASMLLLFGSIGLGTVNTALLLGDHSSTSTGIIGVIFGGAAIVGGFVIDTKYDTPESDLHSGALLVTGTFSAFMGMFVIKHSQRRVSVEPTVSSHKGRLEPGLLLRVQF